MSWFRKKKQDRFYSYDFDDPAMAAEKMRLFSEDISLLSPMIGKHESFDVAYAWAVKGFEMAAKDYHEALKRKGLMSR